MENESYLNQLAEIRSMMERSTKFMSLAGWSGVLAGIYALIGTYLAHYIFGFQPDQFEYTFSYNIAFLNLPIVGLIAGLVLVLAIGTAVLLSALKARKSDEKIWNNGGNELRCP